MPRGWEDLGARYASVTNWSAFAKGIVLPNGCVDELHLAYMPHATHEPPLPPASVWAMAILFCPYSSSAPHSLAMVLIGDASFHERVRASGISSGPLCSVR